MSGNRRVMQLGPETVTVSVPVLGGQLVEPDTSAGNTGKVKPCTAGSVKFLGVARNDGQPAGTNPTNPLNIAWGRPDIAIDYAPADVDTTFAAAANFGDLLMAAANGQVTPAGATPAVGTVVGRCSTPAGVAAATVGRMRLL